MTSRNAFATPGVGATLRAASAPIGRDSTTPNSVAASAICTVTSNCSKSVPKIPPV